MAAEGGGGNVAAAAEGGGGNVAAEGGGGNMAAAAEGGSGNVAAEGGGGNVAAECGGGNVAAEGGSGNVAAEGGSGNVAAEGGSGNVAAEGGGGNMEGSTKYNILVHVYVQIYMYVVTFSQVHANMYVVVDVNDRHLILIFSSVHIHQLHASTTTKTSTFTRYILPTYRMWLAANTQMVESPCWS